MSASLVAAVTVLVGAGVFLVTSRSLSRIVLGFSLLGHASVLALLAAGGPAGTAPIGAETEGVSDPLPQAFSLTAIVIAFGLTLFLLALAVRQRQLTGDDLVQDDVEDRRVARYADDDPETFYSDPDDDDEHDDDAASEHPVDGDTIDGADEHAADTAHGDADPTTAGQTP